MTELTVNGQTINNPEPILIVLVVAFFFIYILPALYNFSKLYEKAKQPGWAVIIPIYGQIIAARIGKKPIWLAVLAGILGFVHFSSPSSASHYIAAIQSVLAFALGLFLLVGMSKQYKANTSFWYLSVLMPLAATFQLKSVKYSPKKS